MALVALDAGGTLVIVVGEIVLFVQDCVDMVVVYANVVYFIHMVHVVSKGHGIVV